MERNNIDRGLKVRREVLGDRYVDRAVADANTFDIVLQELLSGYAWGEVWGRPGLERRERSLVTIAMLTAVSPSNELRAHVIGALRNGCTATQIREVLVQATVYLGFPRAIAAFRIAKAAIAEVEAHPELLEENTDDQR